MENFVELLERELRLIAHAYLEHGSACYRRQEDIPALEELIERRRCRRQYRQRSSDLPLEATVAQGLLAKTKRAGLECVFQPRDPVRLGDCIHGFCDLDVG